MPPSSNLSIKDLEYLQTRIQPSNMTLEELALKVARYGEIQSEGARFMKSDPTKAQMLLKTLQDPQTRPPGIRWTENIDSFKYTRDELLAQIDQYDGLLEKAPETFEEYFIRNVVAIQATILVEQFCVSRPLRNEPAKNSAYNKRRAELTRALVKRYRDSKSPSTELSKDQAPESPTSSSSSRDLDLLPIAAGALYSLGSPPESSNPHPNEDRPHLPNQRKALLTQEEATQLANDPLKLSSLILLNPDHIEPNDGDDPEAEEEAKWRLAGMNFAGSKKAPYEMEYITMSGSLIPLWSKEELVYVLMCSYVVGEVGE